MSSLFNDTQVYDAYYINPLLEPTLTDKNIRSSKLKILKDFIFKFIDFYALEDTVTISSIDMILIELDHIREHHHPSANHDEYNEEHDKVMQNFHYLPPGMILSDPIIIIRDDLANNSSLSILDGSSSSGSSEIDSVSPITLSQKEWNLTINHQTFETPLIHCERKKIKEALWITKKEYHNVKDDDYGLHVAGNDSKFYIHWDYATDKHNNESICLVPSEYVIVVKYYYGFGIEKHLSYSRCITHPRYYGLVKYSENCINSFGKKKGNVINNGMKVLITQSSNRQEEISINDLQSATFQLNHKVVGYPVHMVQFRNYVGVLYESTCGGEASGLLIEVKHFNTPGKKHYFHDSMMYSSLINLYSFVIFNMETYHELNVFQSHGLYPYFQYIRR